MWPDLKQVYTKAWHFIWVFPLLFLIPVLVEMVQHIAEIQIGFYDSVDDAKTLETNGWRMVFGFAKVIALTVSLYWGTRYFAFGSDKDKVAAIDPLAIKLFAIVVAFQLSFAAIQLFALPLIPGPIGQYALGAFAVFSFVFPVYLFPWVVAAPLANDKIGFLQSIKLMHGSFWRSILLFIAAFLPVMAVHYALGFGAIGQPRAIVWTMLLLDALVVGYIAIIMAGTGYVAAHYAVARKHVPLLPTKGDV